MAVYNYAGGEINIKIVYYGPGLSGKTTNLEHMYSKLPRENKGKMVSMKTRTDRTLFFDFLPIEVGELGGMNVRFLLYTVPGQVYYNATRKLVLKGVDAVVFVADSASERMDDNKESLDNLEENLNEIGLSLAEIPWVIQYNKRDLDSCLAREELDRVLNLHKVPAYEATANTGDGVYETFEGIAKQVFESLKKEIGADTVRKEKGASQEKKKEKIAVEVVAQGKQRIKDSGTDESESFSYAEEREEEHESVSEFVDNVLKEGEISGEKMNLGSNREAYEEYGHVVELADKDEDAGEEGQPSAETAEKEPEASEAAEVKDPPREKMDIINDPLDKLSDESSQEEIVSPEMDQGGDEIPFEKIVKVPLELTEEDIRNQIPVKVVIDIKMT